MFVVVLLLGASIGFSAESRTWTDKKGRTLEGKLMKLDGTVAVIELKAGKEVRLDRKLLSAGDNEYLNEYGGGEVVVPSGKVGKPEKDARIDTKTFKKLEDPFLFPGSEIALDALQTAHFLILSEGSLRPKDIAVTAERMWQGMAFQHPGFAEKWGDERRAIFVVEESTHASIGEWYGKYLEENDKANEAMKLGITWPKASGSSIKVPETAIEEYNLMDMARVFRVSDSNKSTYKKVFTPFVTHCLASDMITAQMGATSGFGAAGRFAITTGHAYYKEIQLAGKSGTSLISAKYDSSEIQNSRGFADGTSWAKGLKKLVRKRDVVPSIEALYAYKVEELKPEELVLTYSFSYFMQSEMARLSAYTKMIARAESSRNIPAPVELAKIFGYESVEDLEKAWTEFIRSTAFRD
ncbi:MAG: hypothetical protein OSA84_10020 [Akkermansiaceae bacterium]|nr:hypothetical protein [Akkermansiaceae bacterium]